MQYQPRLLVDERHTLPHELEMHEDLSPALQEWAVDELLDDMMTAKAALQMPAHLPPKARFA